MPEKSSEIENNAKSLRQNMTKEEGVLWHMFLKSLPVHFYRQRIIEHYIVDFYCPAAKLVIEVDGSQHYEKQAAVDYDDRRTSFLKKKGLTVLRIQNVDINMNLRGVCEEIERILNERVPNKFG